VYWQLGRDAGGFFSGHSLDEYSTVGIVYALDFSLEPCEVSSHDADAVAGSYREPSDLVVLGEIVGEPGGEHSSSAVLWSVEEHLPLLGRLRGSHSRSPCSLGSRLGAIVQQPPSPRVRESQCL